MIFTVNNRSPPITVEEKEKFLIFCFVVLEEEKNNKTKIRQRKAKDPNPKLHQNLQSK